MIYIGSASSPEYDQELESVFVGPIVPGINKFVLSAPAPDPEKIPDEDILGATVVLLTCSYFEKEFIRVGYYVNNEIPEEDAQMGKTGEDARDGSDDAAGTALPAVLPVKRPSDYSKIRRVILSEEPRVTEFPINWEDPEHDIEVKCEKDLFEDLRDELKENLDTNMDN